MLDQLARTQSDQNTWSTLIQSLADRLGRDTSYFDESYIANARWLLKQNTIPTLAAINEWLTPTGWKIAFVSGYVPVLEYLEMQRNRVFPVAHAIRKLRDLEHAAAPDIYHDLIGHLPMLFNEQYSELVVEWANKGVSSKPTKADIELSQNLRNLIIGKDLSVQPGEIERLTSALVRSQLSAMRNSSSFFKLQNFYTWVMEFGVLHRTSDSIKIIGGAALSSRGEMERIIRREIVIEQLNANSLTVPVDYTEYQRKIYASSFASYFHLLRAIGND